MKLDFTHTKMNKHVLIKKILIRRPLFIKRLSQRPDQERAISTTAQKISISAPNAKRSYLNLHFKKGLSRLSVQKGSISAVSLIASHALKFYSIHLIIKLSR